MRIGILGTGTMAQAVGRRFARAGHRVRFGSRTTDRATQVAAAIGSGATGGPYDESAALGEIVVLALDWNRVSHVLRGLPSLHGKVMIDCTNPEGADGRSLAIGFVTSGAEEIARLAPDARVVKALNHVYAEVLDVDEAGARAPVVFLCGDDAAAVAVVGDLLRAAHLEPMPVGALCQARYLEPFAMLLVELGRTHQLAADQSAIRFNGRGEPVGMHRLQ